MKKTMLASSVLALSLLFTGCTSDDDNREEMHDHGDDKRAVVFYNATQNYHYVYDVAEEETINLNDANYTHDGEVVDIVNFTLENNESGKPFIWLDNKGDDNESNDEEKIVMFKSDYNYLNDGNATWESFYYIGHFHAEEEDGETHYHLAAHSNDEFNVTSGAKLMALGRLNTYLAEQFTLEQNLSSKLQNDADGSTNLCGIYTNIDHEEEETTYFAMGTNGKLYVFDENKTKSDSVQVGSSCTAGEMGMSGIEHGVWVFLANTQKVYEVDSHDDGVYHVHETHDADEFVPAGKDMKLMVSFKPLEEEHDH